MSTKNLGQVSAIHVGTTPPTNTLMVWYDSNPFQMYHKIYDANIGEWIPINNSILSSITYAELVNLASTTGLSIGKAYVITDQSNLLSFAITSTKVLYVDNVGNIIIDDLGGSDKQYHVTSSNLRFDGIAGTFDGTNYTLDFTFVSVPDSDVLSDTTIVYGAQTISGSTSRVKFSLKRLISAVTGNSLTWNNGIYFNFTTAISNATDQPGGFVSYNKYLAEQTDQDTRITTIANQYGTLLNTVTELINNSTSDTAVYNKKLPAPLSTNYDPVIINDTLQTIINKFRSQFADRVFYGNYSFISNDAYARAQERIALSQGNTLKAAISQLDYRSWDTNGTILPSNFVIGTDVSNVAANDVLTTAIAKLQRQINTGEVGNFTIKNGKLAAGTLVQDVVNRNGGILSHCNFTWVMSTDESTIFADDFISGAVGLSDNQDVPFSGNTGTYSNPYASQGSARLLGSSTPAAPGRCYTNSAITNDNINNLVWQSHFAAPKYDSALTFQLKAVMKVASWRRMENAGYQYVVFTPTLIRVGSTVLSGTISPISDRIGSGGSSLLTLTSFVNPEYLMAVQSNFRPHVHIEGTLKASMTNT